MQRAVTTASVELTIRDIELGSKQCKTLACVSMEVMFEGRRRGDGRTFAPYDPAFVPERERGRAGEERQLLANSKRAAGAAS